MDVSHELGALRFVVDSPLSSKVAMFNQQVNQHKQSQLLNPFSQTDGRASPKPSFSKDEYGKPLAGSLTEMRGQKANMHVLKEMLELCQIIDSEGYNVKDEPTMRVIPFGELFNIYNYISDKVVGILLRARKHKLVEFEGEMLFQRRDDDVPIFLIKPIHEIRREMQEKIESIKRTGSPAPQATSVLLDKRAHGLDVPKGATPRSSVSRTPSPEPKAKTATAKTTATNNVEQSAVTAEAVKAGTVEQSSVAAEENSSPKETATAEALQPKEAAKSNEVVAPPQQQDSATIKTETKTDVNNNNNSQNDLPTIVIETSAVSEAPAEVQAASETVNDVPIADVPAATESINIGSNVPAEPSPSA